MPGQPATYEGQSITIVTASQYSFQELAAIYNQTRIDYIVPMPMNARRMEEYVRYYDVDIDRSFVALNDQGEQTGLGMLGVRGERTWITRLGIIPERRGHKIGLHLMEALIEAAQDASAQTVQLEVIEGNEPALHLFVKLGFAETRRLLVIRRPPGAAQLDPAVTLTPLTQGDLRACLDARPASASWLDETLSLLNAGGLHGLRVSLPSGVDGWIVWHETPLQLSHLVLSAPDQAVALALLQALHQSHPSLDTKLENLPVDSPHWSAFQQVGYVESFRRIEMLMSL